MLKHRGSHHMTDETLDKGLVTAMKDAHADETAGLSELEIEKINARRMLRVAAWSTVFCAFICSLISSGYERS
jgi:hypothetical protein